MIDLHCHLAFGVDDGPRVDKESLELGRTLLSAGVTQVACTSHLRRDKNWVNDMTQQNGIHSNLDRVLGEKDVNLHRVQGAEHYMDELLVETCQKKEVVPFTGTQWLLVELPYYGPPPNMLNTLYQIRRLGYRILLAHLERFEYVTERPDVLESIFNAGYAIQVNLGSLAGAYHKKHKKIAERLVCEGFAHVAAGDCHRADDVKECIENGRRALRKLVGDSGERQLLIANPQKILHNAAPEELTA